MKEINFSDYKLKHDLNLIDIKLNENSDSKISLTNIKIFISLKILKEYILI